LTATALSEPETLLLYSRPVAGVVELVDTSDSNSDAVKRVPVRVRPPVPISCQRVHERSMRNHASTIVALVLGTSGLISPAAAETELPLEQVLVTATQRSQDGTVLPLAWSAISADDIDFAAHTHINELMQRIAGAWISRGDGQEHLTAIRSPVLTGPGSCGAFLMAIDGVEIRAPGFCNVNQLFEINSEQAQRIEVLKGPGTAVYGSRAMHGIINVISAPAPREFDHSIAIEAGANDFYRVKYAVGGSKGHHALGLRFNGVNAGSFKDAAGYDQQKLSLRYDIDGEQVTAATLFEITNLNQETAGFITGFQAYRDSALRSVNPNPEAYRDARALRLQNHLTWIAGDSDTVTLVSYLRDNRMEFLQHFLAWRPTEENGHQSAGGQLRWHATRDRIEFTSGLAVDITDGYLKESQAAFFSPILPGGVNYDFDVLSRTAAAYSQVEWRPAERWLVSAGLRQEYNHYRYRTAAAPGANCAPSVTACRVFRPDDRNDHFHNGSQNLGLSWQLHDQLLGFVRVARGFRAPETSELYRLQAGQAVADLDAERAISREIGLRGNVAQALRFELAAYDMDKRDVIFQDSDRQNVSGARTRHRGIDMMLRYKLTEDLGFAVDWNVARHTFRDERQLPGIRGNDITTSPRQFGSARLSWEPLASDWLSRIELEWVQMGRYYLDPQNVHRYNGHGLLNLRTRIQPSPRSWIGLRLTNLLDRDYAERADFGFGQYRYFVGQGRAGFLELGLQLNR